MLVYCVGVNLSTRHLKFVSDALRADRAASRTRWRILSSHRTGTCARPRALSGLAPSLQQAMQVAARKAYVTLEGTLLRIDRVAMASKNARVYYSGNTRHPA